MRLVWDGDSSVFNIPGKVGPLKLLLEGPRSLVAKVWNKFGLKCNRGNPSLLYETLHVYIIINMSWWSHSFHSGINVPSSPWFDMCNVLFVASLSCINMTWNIYHAPPLVQYQFYNHLTLGLQPSGLVITNLI